MEFEIKNRWSGAVQFTAEIEAGEGTSFGVKIGLAVRWGWQNNAVLSGADLRGAVLSDADLRGADLRGVPKIPNIHQSVYFAASADRALDMSTWHTCETTHCRAGWVVTLAGDAGRALEFGVGTAAAAAFIYLKSDPTIERIPDFYCGNEAALADMKRLAEAASQAASGA
ncbi:MAG: pentapeptide repeat-containing protein [Undibacterium sp.]